jgi:molybdopterin synthase catalytic subunit
MKIKVLFFGFTHDLTGFDQELVEVTEGGRLEDLWREYQGRFPDFDRMGGSLLAAVNQEIAEQSQILRDGDEVAFLPPVSGGSSTDFCAITHDRISTYSLAQQLKAPEDGAVVIFEGIVRDHSRGRRTAYLEYEAYEPMAIRKMEEIARDARQKFPIHAVAMVHRVGRLAIGETSVTIIVTSPHRGAAFEACHYAIDRLKQIVPIWKKEFFEDGGVWAEGEGQSQSFAEARK